MRSRAFSPLRKEASLPRNSAGTFTLPESPFVPNTPISSAAVNSDFSDIASAITDSLSRNGEGGMSAALGLALNGFFYTSDPDTGMSRSAANTQVITCGGQNWTFSATDATSPSGASLLDLIGEIKMYAFSTAPTGWIFMRGQACTTSFPLWRAGLVASGNPYGTSGGDPLFPNMQCVVPAGFDGTGRGLLTGSGTLGNFLGAESVALAGFELPAVSPTGTISQITPAGSVSTTINNQGPGVISDAPGASYGGGGQGTRVTLTASSSFSGTPVTPTFTGDPIGNGVAHANVQPTIIINFIGRAA